MYAKFLEDAIESMTEHLQLLVMSTNVIFLYG